MLLYSNNRVLLVIFYISSCFILQICNAKSFSKCQLATELVEKGIPENDVGVWLCIIGPIRDSSKGFSDIHGLFYISGQWWCISESAPYTNNGCNMDCSKLQDDDLTDDVSCALHIYKAGGYGQWGSRSYSCTTSGKVNVTECFPNSIITATGE